MNNSKHVLNLDGSLSRTLMFCDVILTQRLGVSRVMWLDNFILLPYVRLTFNSASHPQSHSLKNFLHPLLISLHFLNSTAFSWMIYNE